MKDELLYVDYVYRLKGKQSKFWKRSQKRDVECLRIVDGVYIIANKDNLEDKVKERIEKNIKGFKNTIKEDGYISLLNWEAPFLENVLFEEIDEYVLEKVDYAKATIKECISQLTPQQFVDIYGSVLNLEMIKDV